MPIYPYSFQLPPLSTQDIPNNGAVGEFLGISAGGVLDWLPVSSASGDMLKSENLSGLASYPTARTNLGLGLTDTPTFKNLVISTGSIATSAPVTISQTWNDAAVAFTALKVNATTPGSTSAAGSLLLDLQVGGVSAVSIRKDGAIILPFSYPGIIDNSNNTGGTNYTWAGTRLGGAATVAWTSGGPNGAPDTILVRDGAANTLALRNGAAAQTFNVYGTWTSASVYARLAIACDTSGNATLTTQSTGVAGTVSINGVPVGRGGGSVSTNFAIGQGALAGMSTGGNNLALGINALTSGNTHNNSISIGNSTLTLGGGDGNVAVGFRSLAFVQGSNNIGLGRDAGMRILDGNTYTWGDTSIFIGFDTRPAANYQSNQIVIGHAATGLGSNTVVLGNASITTTALRGNVGIGTTAPAAKLHITGGDASTDFNSATIALGFGTTGEYRHFIHTRHAGTAANNFIDFYTSNGTAAGTYPTNAVHGLTINNGLVGIGTTAPSSKLHVVGTIKPEQATMVDKAAGFTLAAVDAGTIINSTSATAITINLPAADTATGYNVMIIQSGAGPVTIGQNGNTLNSFGGAVITAGQHAACSIVRTAASTYNLSGNLV